MKTKFKRLLSVILVLCTVFLFSININLSLTVEASGTMTNISIGTDYMFSYRDAITLEGDDAQRDLTKDYTGKVNTNPAYVTIKNPSNNFVDWWGNKKSVNIFDEKDPHFYIKNDLGFVAEVKKISITFNQGRGLDLPRKVEVFYSNDGYNFNYYAGVLSPTANSNKTVEYSKSFSSALQVKAVKYVVYAPLGYKVAVGSIASYGEKKNDRVLLSKNAKVTIDASVMNSDGNKMLTDGVTGTIDREPVYVIADPTKVDSLANTNALYFTIDLGSVKNVAEVQVSSLVDSYLGFTSIKYIRVQTSTDGKNYSSFSMSAAYNRIGRDALYKEYFKAMRNHTVKARYVKVAVMASSTVAIDEISVYGCNNEVKEPTYNFKNNRVKSYTNVAESKPVTVNGTSYGDKLTNVIFRAANSLPSSQSLTPTNKTVEIVLDLQKSYSSLKGYEISFNVRNGAGSNISSMTLSSSTNGSSYETIGNLTDGYVLSNIKTYRLSFNKQARYFKLVIKTTDNNPVQVSQIQVFENEVMMPVIRGGWYTYYHNSDDSYMFHYRFDEYMMYLALKGFKELGMDYIVGPSIAEYPDKTTLDETPSFLKSKGYKKGTGRGPADFYEALFTAADKLDMAVFMGTFIVGNYPQISGDKIAHYKKTLDELLPMIEYNYNKYKNHRSFVGFYLTEETCDQWLSEGGNKGTEHFRYLYKRQSDEIRRLDSKKLIAIAPAVWRAGGTENFGNNMYNLIKGENGGRPIVDIVSAQDCLGRLPSIIVDDGTYGAYENYLQYLAKAVRNAGAEYYSDIEIFDVHYKTKRYSEIVRSLNLHSRFTNGNWVFDVMNYFSPMARGNFSTYSAFDTEYIVQEYVKYLSNNVSQINNSEFDNKPVQIKVILTDSENMSVKLQGAKFQLVNSKGKTVGTQTTNSNGEAVFTLTGTGIDSYTLTQASANSSYLKRNGSISFSITRESQMDVSSSGYAYVLPVVNDKKGGAIEVVVRDSANKDKYINGAVFQIKDSNGKVVDTVTTGATGTVVSKTLSLGKYTVTQVKAANNYKMSNKSVQVTIQNDGDVVKAQFENEIIVPITTMPPKGGGSGGTNPGPGSESTGSDAPRSTDPEDTSSTDPSTSESQVTPTEDSGGNNPNNSSSVLIYVVLGVVAVAAAAAGAFFIIKKRHNA